VSAIVPVHNRPWFVREALESALKQDCPGGMEIVVVDDGSTDETPDVLRSFGSAIRVVRQENSGPAHARNLGFREARGELFALLDSDDVWLPGKMRAQLAALDADPETCLVHSDVEEFFQDGSGRRWTRRPPVLAGDVHRDLLRRNFVHTMTVVVRRSAIETVGGFDPAYPPCEDWDLWLRLAERWPFAGDRGTRVRTRVHEGGISADPIVVYAKACAVLEAAADRLLRDGHADAGYARRQAARWNVKLGKRLARKGRGEDAERCFARAAALHPLGRLGAAVARAFPKRSRDAPNF